MPKLRSIVIVGCSLLGASTIAMANPAASNAACLLGLSGTVCNNGVLNTSPTSTGIANLGPFNNGIGNIGAGNTGLLNIGALNTGALNLGVGHVGLLG